MSFEKVREVVIETINCSEDEVTMESSLVDDLGMDSLDAVELVMALEEAFGISIAEEKVAEFETIKDIVNYIDALQ